MQVLRYDFQTNNVQVISGKGCWGHLCLTPDGLYFQGKKDQISVYRADNAVPFWDEYAASYVFAIPSGVIIVDMDYPSNEVSAAYVCDTSSGSLKKIEVQ